MTAVGMPTRPNRLLMVPSGRDETTMGIGPVRGRLVMPSWQVPSGIGWLMSKLYRILDR